MIFAGFGFRSSANAESLEQALRAAAGEHAFDAIATAADKADTAVFREFAGRVRKPIRAIASETLLAQSTYTQSAASQVHRQTGSVAEAAALAAAGPGATLIAARVISADGYATCALAQGEDT